jgi:hypothetical protein
MSKDDSELSASDYKRLLLQSIHVATMVYLDAREYLKDIDPNNETHSFWLTADMYDLAVQFKNHPRGHCDACNTWSPLKPGEHEGSPAMICAWDEGCQ